jgi:hypothetical protein
MSQDKPPQVSRAEAIDQGRRNVLLVPAAASMPA